MKLASRSAVESPAELPTEVYETIGPGWHVVLATADHPEVLFCVELRQVELRQRDGDRFAGPLVWHPHPRRVDLDEWVEFTGWTYVLDAHTADQHGMTKPS